MMWRMVWLLITLVLAAGCGSGVRGRGETGTETAAESINPESGAREDGQSDSQGAIYLLPIRLEGGSGRAKVVSPARTVIYPGAKSSSGVGDPADGEGSAVVEIAWSSPYYDYMLVDGEKYLPVNTSGNSVFRLPVIPGTPSLPVRADTTAMSQAHEIDYTLHFDWDAIEPGTQESVNTSRSGRDGADGSVGTGDSSKCQDEPMVPAPPDIPGLTLQSVSVPEYAVGFLLYHYDHGADMVDMRDGGRYLLLPRGIPVPQTAGDITILYKKPERIYVAATAVMSLLERTAALDEVAYSSLSAESWYVDSAAEAMRAGAMQYAGKYNQPDYEQLLSGGCDLAIESTMILHAPEVREKLEALGIPVLTDYSSYERNPLGRTEWIRVYGALTGHEKEAAAWFEGQKRILSGLGKAEGTGKNAVSGKIAAPDEEPGTGEADGIIKTAVFFYINTAGQVVVRRPDDYMPEMIRMAGGRYALDGSDSGAVDSRSGSMVMTMEEFYARAREADILIYNASIEQPIRSRDDLTAKNGLFADFKAVKDNQVWTTDKSFYQQTARMGDMILELRKVLSGQKAVDSHFLHPVS